MEKTPEVKAVEYLAAKAELLETASTKATPVEIKAAVETQIQECYCQAHKDGRKYLLALAREWMQSGDNDGTSFYFGKKMDEAILEIEKEGGFEKDPEPVIETPVIEEEPV